MWWNTRRWCHVCDCGESLFILMMPIHSLVGVAESVRICMGRSGKCEQHSMTCLFARFCPQRCVLHSLSTKDSFFPFSSQKQRPVWTMTWRKMRSNVQETAALNSWLWYTHAAHLKRRALVRVTSFSHFTPQPITPSLHCNLDDSGSCWSNSRSPAAWTHMCDVRFCTLLCRKWAQHQLYRNVRMIISFHGGGDT